MKQCFPCQNSYLLIYSVVVFIDPISRKIFQRTLFFLLEIWVLSQRRTTVFFRDPLGQIYGKKKDTITDFKIGLTFKVAYSRPRLIHSTNWAKDASHLAGLTTTRRILLDTLALERAKSFQLVNDLTGLEIWETNS